MFLPQAFKFQVMITWVADDLHCLHSLETIARYLGYLCTNYFHDRPMGTLSKYPKIHWDPGSEMFDPDPSLFWGLSPKQVRNTETSRRALDATSNAVYPSSTIVHDCRHLHLKFWDLWSKRMSAYNAHLGMGLGFLEHLTKDPIPIWSS